LVAEDTTMDCLTSWGNHGMAGTPAGEKLTVHYKRKVGRPLCGDRIIVNTETEQAQVEQILPRATRFARADKRGRPQWIAANADQVAIIIAAEPAPSHDLIERYLVACELLQIKPLLVLQKTDLDASCVAELRARIAQYEALGYTALEVSAHSGAGLPRLRDMLCRQRTLFTGQSGVGKSSLISALIPDLNLQTRALSVVTGKGTHTTSTACMYYLPRPSSEADAGSVIDTPGVWEYSLWKMSPAELAAGFVEFQPWLDQCRFRDCQHIDTPGCAVTEAASRGDISQARYATYLRLAHEQSRFR
jgi:ribosome biogenesis GTPase